MTLLLGFVTADQHDDDRVVLALLVIDPIARAYINAQLGHAFLQISVITGVPVGQALDARLNT